MRRQLDVARVLERLLAVALLAAIAAFGACGNGGGFPDAHSLEPPPDPGTFALGWAIQNGSGSAQTCMQAMATLVIVGTRNEATGGQDSAQFNCAQYNALSGALSIGTYDLTFTLVGSAGNQLATAPGQNGVVITSDHTTPTTAITFVVN